jgi:hypothetical protein
MSLFFIGETESVRNYTRIRNKEKLYNSKKRMTPCGGRQALKAYSPIIFTLKRFFVEHMRKAA